MAKRIGELLVEYNVITEKQLTDALEIQKSTKRRLGDILLDLGNLQSDQLYWVLSRQAGLPYILLSSQLVDPELVRSFPKSLLYKYNFIPLLQTGKELMIVVSDPTDQNLIEDLKKFTNKAINVSIAEREKIQSLLEETWYDFEEKDELAEIRSVIPLNDYYLTQAELSSLKALMNYHHGIIVFNCQSDEAIDLSYSMLTTVELDRRKVYIYEETISHRMDGALQLMRSRTKDPISFASQANIIVYALKKWQGDEIAQLVNYHSRNQLVLLVLNFDNNFFAVNYLLDLKIPAAVLASRLRGMVSVCAPRKLCPACRTAYVPDLQIARLFKLKAKQKLFQAGGCTKCRDLGYADKIWLFDIFVNDDLAKKDLTARRMPKAIEHGSFGIDTRTIRGKARHLLIAGQTGLSEVINLF